MICSCTDLAITWPAGITVTGLFTCSASSFPVAVLISTNNIFRLCPSFTMKAFERPQLYKICAYMGSLIICQWVYNHIYSSLNSSCSKVHLNTNVRKHGSFQPPFLMMKSISSSHFLTLVDKTWSGSKDRIISLPFYTHRITSLDVVFWNFGRQLLAVLPARLPELVAGHSLHRLPFSLPPQFACTFLQKHLNPPPPSPFSIWGIIQRQQVLECHP